MLFTTKLERTFFFFLLTDFFTLFPFTQVLAHSGEYSYYRFKVTFGNSLYNYLEYYIKQKNFVNKSFILKKPASHWLIAERHRATMFLLCGSNSFNASATRVLSCKNKWSCFLFLKQKEFVLSKIWSFVTYLLYYHGNYTFWFDKLAPCFK